MTHAFDPAARPADALPVDFAERSAYMRLYSAQVHGDSYWPVSAFGDEITVLLERCHAVMTPSGYVLTAAGVTHWQATKTTFDKETAL